MSLSKRTDLLCSVSDDGRFSASKAAELLSVSRKSLYTKAKELSAQELAAKHLIDKLHTAHPAWGSRQLSRQLKAAGMKMLQAFADSGKLKKWEYQIHLIFRKLCLDNRATIVKRRYDF